MNDTSLSVDDGSDRRFHKLGNFITLDELIKQLSTSLIRKVESEDLL